MTWEKLAAEIRRMTQEERRRPVYAEANGGLVYGVIVDSFETDTAVCLELAAGYPILKITN